MGSGTAAAGAGELGMVGKGAMGGKSGAAEGASFTGSAGGSMTAWARRGATITSC